MVGGGGGGGKSLSFAGFSFHHLASNDKEILCIKRFSTYFPGKISC